ncbi:MAG: endonuclease/exonuclease/phosphatase family protein [Epsilonproteobacteria bacterium]|nr:endonuclease/exonuclease/phosphatase family protein [Campylobacterota bacterium]
MRYFILVFLVLTSLFAKDFKIATYNVQNLFDLKVDGGEYKEYIPNTKSKWNKKNFDIKLANIAKVIKNLNADIIALEEVENLNVARELNRALGDKKYPYIYTFYKKNSHIVGSVIFSRYKVANKYSVPVKGYPRTIHVTKFYLDGNKITIYVNHWPAYKHGYKARSAYAKKLKSSLNDKEKFIILGDLNTPLRISQNGWGKSLKNILDVGNFNKPLYDLWYEVEPTMRYTHVYGRDKNALDHIIISKNLFDNNGVKYKPDSFNVFKAKYMVDKYGYPKRWKLTKNGVHEGIGYSDHLPIYATFQTKPYNDKKIQTVTITYLKDMFNDLLPAIIKNVEAVRVDKYGVMIGDGKDQVKIYLPDDKFVKGEKYDILVQKLGKYDRKVEIRLCRIIRKVK